MLAGIAVLFAALAVIAASGAVIAGEAALGRWLQGTPGGSALEPVADAVALKGAQGALVVAFAVLALRARRPALAASALLVLVALTLNAPMKELIGRARPTVDDMALREPAPGLGFPSGHSSSAVLLYGYIIVVASRVLRPRLAFPVVGACAALVLLIAWDRVWDGAHWPSDVAGGLAFGALLLAAAVWLPERARPARPPGAARERAVASSLDNPP
jgi:undecaprenyl-diphosphatase